MRARSPRTRTPATTQGPPSVGTAEAVTAPTASTLAREPRMGRSPGIGGEVRSGAVAGRPLAAGAGARWLGTRASVLTHTPAEGPGRGSRSKLGFSFSDRSQT